MNINIENCDNCRYYEWYYDHCCKWNCKVDGRSIQNCFMPSRRIEMTEPKWRSDPVTNKQMNYIMELYEHDEFRRIPKFTGTTKGEASDFIDKYAHFAYESFDNEYHDSNYGDRI